MLLSSVTHNDSQSHTHTHAHHGVEGLLLLLLLQEQIAGQTFSLAVTAPRSEETCQQHHQVPQRDLHRSEQPDRQGQTGAQQEEEKSLKPTSGQQLENQGAKAYGIWVQPTGRKQTE